MEWALGTEKLLDDIYPFTDATGASAGATPPIAHLIAGSRIFCALRVTNGANISSLIASDGVKMVADDCGDALPTSCALSTS